MRITGGPDRAHRHAHRGPSRFRLLAYLPLALLSIACCYAPRAHGEPGPAWQNIGPGGGGWFQTIASSPHDTNVLCVGGDVGGFYKSVDGGASYTIYNTGLQCSWVECIVFHPSDPDVMYLGCQSGTYRSTNGGESWEWIRAGFPSPTSHRWSAPIGALVIDETNPSILYAGISRPRMDEQNDDPEGQGAVYKTTNGGDSWFKVNTGGDFPSDAAILDLQIDVRDSSHLYLTCWSRDEPENSGVFQSHDGGVSWAQTVSGLPHNHTRRIAQCAAAPDTLYVTIKTQLWENDTKWVGGVYKSTDDGHTWVKRTSGLGKSFDPSVRQKISTYDRLEVDPRDPDIVYVGGVMWWSGLPYKSTDGGESWYGIDNYVEPGWIQGIGKAVKGFCMSPVDPDLLHFCTSMMVFKSTDLGESWYQKYSRLLPDGRIQTTGLEITVAQAVAVDPSDPLRLYLGYADINMLTSDDGGQTFRSRKYDMPSAARGNCVGFVFDPHDSDHCWASMEGSGAGVIESFDHGQNWSIAGSPGSGLPGNSPLLVADPNSPPGATRLLAWPAGHGIYYSDDNGQSWVPRSDGMSSSSARALLAHPTQPDTFLCASSSKIYRTVDRGMNWERISNSSLRAKDIKRMVLAPSLPDRIYLTARDGWDGSSYPGGVFRSDDGGRNWAQVYDDDFMAGLAVDPFDEDLVYAGSADHPFHDMCIGDGLFRTTDGGATWQSFNGTGLTRLSIGNITISPHDHTELYVTAGGNGVFKGRIGNQGALFTPAASTDDAEEQLDTDAVWVSSSDLEMVTENAAQLVGIRFKDIAIPRGVSIERAYVQFTVDETGSQSTTLTIHGEDTDDASAFSTQPGDITARPRTAASVDWHVPAWTAKGLAGTDQQTPNLAAVIQEIVDRPGWTPGNELALLISGSGKRVAVSYDGDAQHAPVLCVEFVPAAPDSAAAVPLSSSRIALSWADRSENEDGFKIHRRQSGTSNWVWLTTVPGNTTTYEDTGLPEDTKFYYRLKAYNPVGESAYSNTAQARTAQNPPAPPGAPSAVALSASEIEIRWADNSYNEDGFRLDRRRSGYSAWSALAAPTDATAYLDTALRAETKYYYKVTATHAGVGDSATIGPASAITARPPQAFTAYNDLAWFDGQPAANITRYTRGQQGLLVDHATGTPVGALLTIDHGGDGPLAQGTNAVAGTDAHAVFDGKLDLAGVIGYGSNLSLTISGLSRALTYTIVLCGNRGEPDYTDRRTRYTIDADSSVNRSSDGTWFSGPADPTVSIRNGYNTLRGHVARFEGVNPGADGAFEIVIADGGSGAPPKFYLGALMLKAEEGQAPAAPVGNGAVWQYRKGTGEASMPSTAWQRGAGPADRPGWTNGLAPFGYGDDTFGTELTDMQGAYSCVFMRKAFQLDAPALVSRIDLDILYDDGFVAWINGQEVARVNVAGAPGSFVPCDALANTQFAGPATWSAALAGAAIPALVRGTNVLAIQAFNGSLAASSDLMMDASLLIMTGSDFALAEDADRDGLPDDWEQTYLSDLSDPSDRSDTADPDNDGLSNIEEFIAGTDPGDETGNWKLETRLSGGQVVVSLPTIVATGPGYAGRTRQYAIEQCDGTPNSHWLPVPGYEDIPATGGTVTYIVPATEDPVFHRARVWLSP